MPGLDDACPVGLERLVFETLGHTATVQLAAVRDRKGVYRVDPESLPQLNSGLTAAVVGDSRIESILRSVYRTNKYIADPYAAIPYGAIQDHRARCGESKLTMLFSDNSPVLQANEIADTIGLTADELRAAVDAAKE